MSEQPPERRRICHPTPLLRLGALALALALSSCGRPRQPATAEPPTFSVMTYNLGRYNLQDRDGDGQQNDPKPQSEREAVVSLIALEKPDVLAVQEMGTQILFEEFKDALRKAGLVYPHEEFLQRGESELNLAVLSRFPIVARHPHVDDDYSIGEATILVLRGFVDVEIEVTPTYRFRLMVAHLKSKVYHSLGQTEMRRNEARLLNKHVREALKDDPELNLLVVGDFNDIYSSAALREVTGEKGKYLRDLRPQDADGDVWTHFGENDDACNRIDYLLASAGMFPEYLPESSHVVRNRMTYKASDHRPVMGVFRAEDVRKPEPLPDNAKPSL